MLEEQVKYLNAAKDKSNFFYSTVKNYKETKDFKLNVSLNRKWKVESNKYWRYVLYQPDTLPLQGWKIHLSSTVQQAQKMLDVVIPFLVKEKISFKFVPNVEAVIYQNAKYADRSESGKFITIYPHDDKQFAFLLGRLKLLTDQFDLGPYILSDQNWQESNVYFRYGGFKAIYIQSKNGEKIPAIINPDGQKVVDERVPFYQKPNFVKNLAIFDKNTFPPEETFKPLRKYEIKEALHFSNAGGVYLAVKNGKKYILKEGRSAAGLDANGLDGFTRIEKEARILEKLSTIPAVVNYNDNFVAWRHNFLVEEYIDGELLEDFLPVSFPFLVSEKNKKEKYIRKAKNILIQLKNAINLIHEKGLALGDISLSNIILTNNGQVRLIDLESAEPINKKYNPGLTTVGFVSPNARTFGDADNFALMRIAYYLFLPIEPVTDIGPKIITKQKSWIEKYFGKEIIDFLKMFDLKKKSSKTIFVPKFLDVPNENMNVNNLSKFVLGLRNGILNNLNFNQLQLVPGVVSSDPVDWLNMEEGAMGVIWALYKNTGHINFRLENWIHEYTSQIIHIAKNTTKLGLFNGLSGIASILFKIGKKDVAEKLFELICKKVNLEMNDVSLDSGLSGIALAINNCCPDIAHKIYNTLIKRWNELQNIKDEDVGLLTGWAGVSYLAWKLGHKSKAEEILFKIIELTADSKNNFLIADNSRGFTRLIPYLENGVFGIALLLHEYIAKDSSLFGDCSILDRLKDSSFNYCTYMGTLISGYAGVIPLAYSFAKDGDFKLLDYSLSAMNLYLVGKENEIMIPGKFGYKLGLGYAYGSAGILTVLSNSEKDDDFYWLPL